MMTTETDWIYLAGIVDGEGNLDIFLRTNPAVLKTTKRGYTREFRMNVCNGSRKLLEDINKSIGMLGTIALHRLEVSGKNTKHDSYTLRFSHNSIRKILPKVIPYLRLKKQSAEMMLEMLTLIATTPNNHRREMILLQADERFRKVRCETPGTRCRYNRKDTKMREKLLAKESIELMK